MKNGRAIGAREIQQLVVTLHFSARRDFMVEQVGHLRGLDHLPSQAQTGDGQLLVVFMIEVVRLNGRLVVAIGRPGAHRTPAPGPHWPARDRHAGIFF